MPPSTLPSQAELLQKIFDQIPVMISFFDAKGRLRLVNPEWERKFGWTLPDLAAQGRELLLEAFPDAAERKRARAFVAAAAGEWADFTTRSKDGTLVYGRWVSVRLSEGTLNIGTDITDQRRAEAQLRVTTEQLRALSASLSGAREMESVRISRELHDELGSVLTSLRWDLEALQQDVRAAYARPATLERRVQDLIAMTDSVIRSVRRISSELRPPLLDDLGLAEAVEWQAEQFRERAGIDCGCEVTLEPINLPPAQSTAVFRILQEALTNVLRHAQASKVDIALRPDGDGFVLTVTDDGKGMTDDQRSGPLSLGLLGMRERAHMLGATLDILPAEPTGTVLRLRVPARGGRR